MRSPRRTLAASMLALESISVFLGGLAGKATTTISLGRSMLILGLLALACLLAAGMLRSRAGYLLGSVLQVAVIATGYWIHPMYVVGVVFAVLWFAALRVGTRIERDRARIAHELDRRRQAEQSSAESSTESSS
ncbi:MAG: DUF4233 domain-containing protein [Kineosporiaceae bacterium]